MKQKNRLPFVLMLILVLAITAFTVYAANPGNVISRGNESSNGNNARIILSLKNKKLAVDETLTVSVVVKNAPVIYGSDVRLIFDPQMLEVMDADANQPGIQFAPGDFIDPEKSFIVQNSVNSQTGVIDYALALLKPAPPVSGMGELFQITFRAKTEGRTTISITEGMFGTQTGETVVPALDSIEIPISQSNGNNLQPASDFASSRVAATCLD